MPGNLATQETATPSRIGYSRLKGKSFFLLSKPLVNFIILHPDELTTKLSLKIFLQSKNLDINLRQDTTKNTKNSFSTFGYKNAHRNNDQTISLINQIGPQCIHRSKLKGNQEDRH